MFRKLVYILTLFLLFPTFLSGNNLLDSLTFNRLYDSAWVLYEHKDFAGSLAVLSHIENQIDSTKEYQVGKLSNLFNLEGMVQRNLGNYSQSLIYLNSALDKTSDSALMAVIYMNIGSVLLRQGEYSKVIEYYNNALAMISQNDKYAILEPITFNIGYTYLQSRKWSEAIYYSEKSISINQKADIKDNGFSYLNIASAYKNLNFTDSSNYYFKQSISNFSSVYGVNSFETAHAYMDYGEFLSERNSYKLSESYLQKAYKIFHESLGDKHYNVSRCLLFLGKLNLKKGNAKEALSYFQKSLTSKIIGFDNPDAYTNPKDLLPDMDIIEILKYKSLAFEKLATSESNVANLKAALTCIHMGVDVIENLRMSYLSESSKLLLTENEGKIFSAGIRISGRLYQLTGEKVYSNSVFEFSERSKYGITRELRENNIARYNAGIPNILLQKESKLAGSITELRLYIDQEERKVSPDRKSIEAAYGQLFSFSTELEKLISYFEINFPDYYHQKFSNDVIQLNQVQRSISAGQAVIDYSLKNSSIYTFVITSDTIVYLQQSVDSSFWFSLDFLSRFLHLDYSLDYDTWRKATYSLYQRLIQPVEKYVKGKELIIVPDSTLGQISFESLTTEPYKENKYHKYQVEPYLLYGYPISYSLSATLLFSPENSNGGNIGRFVGFAPDYNNSPDSLPTMPESLVSLRTITRMFFKRSYFGDCATKRNFFKQGLKARIIHFYAHGIEDTLNPALSKMALSYDTIGGSYLYAYEIGNMNLKADLVSLISCYGGSGNQISGEGIISLGRTFFNAGVPSMILSLWAANAFASFQIMEDFYRNLLNGDNKAIALQKAKIKYIKNVSPVEASPRIWSSFVVMGSSEALFNHFILYRNLIIALLIILVVILIYYIYKGLVKLR